MRTLAGRSLPEVGLSATSEFPASSRIEVPEIAGVLGNFIEQLLSAS